ncbi:isocitrate/isopropylmalate dehydrogenase family protein [Sulfolobus acidocaldarius]|uniref:3-isopropylmalate dehydrogenase n=4 Tax=Sulfolobus acidocaldarius TaxID=2285 RepID=Q4JB37_SULAC|nr:isocitrate/isopropylmalate dehydrogenase family protein [Sulfolobus acidocaldarius]4Y1P_A Chain A, 3-isopropylmalate dehydrogenase [Sulfolobus acidocaldarius DSM 639]4Y1P_B Chain B, 3-isopropylmalate dehydrogenase [Sulfolobus acidocaldarius DSM 639]AAY79992.1 3-isopropylmalate dehydrogenase [Sulfolobus acidocaldarius DSM 639]AGE70561.1 3-isopropylmalate dehydrogenase [Sulfolobus acidocaldarius N8]AGE72834.1 3-isopropylmalate dehydrogenase [Sulfolobus acidocaldarius Ron12/I]ALU29080.1 3-iso
MGFVVALIQGDGIGPEVVSKSKTILARLNEKFSLPIEYIEVEAGDTTKNKFGDALPKDSLRVIEKADMILKGPVGETAADVVVKLRLMYDLYANLRPAKSLPGLENKFGDVDILVVRENTEDLYKGLEHVISDGVTVGIKVITRAASTRIAQVALNQALRRKKKVVCVHKSNVMRITDGLFAESCRNVLKGKVEYSEMYVDAAAANLVRNPQAFDVIVTENTYGDILSDEAGQIAGSLGISPSANIGDRKSLFEPVHGAAFDIAGKNIANPTAFLLSVGMMLDRMQELSGDIRYNNAAKSLRDAIYSVYSEGKYLTPDVGGSSTTDEMISAIRSKIG